MYYIHGTERGLGDRNMGTKEACFNYSKGDEAEWEFQVSRRGLGDFHIQCSSALAEAGSLTSSRKTK